MKPRILIIDDMVSMLSAFVDELQIGQWDLFKADSYALAHQRILEARPHLVICDFHLDGERTIQDVIELTRACFSNTDVIDGLPFIAVSASEQQLSTLKDNPNIVLRIAKPFDPGTILEAVKASMQSLEEAGWFRFEPIPREDAPPAPSTGPGLASTFAAPSLALSAAQQTAVAVQETETPNESAILVEPSLDTAGSRAPAPEPASVSLAAVFPLREPKAAQTLLPPPAYAPTAAPQETVVTGDQVAALLDNPVVRSAVGGVLASLVGVQTLLKVPAALVPIEKVVMWARKDPRPLALLCYSKAETICIYIKAGRAVGIASDAWLNDSRADALRGRLLGPPGASDGNDTSVVQLGAVERARIAGEWIEVREELPPAWAAVQDESIRSRLNLALQ